MKRVKVERYVAGKKPAYAKEEDDDDEYYTTDDEDNQSGLDEELSDEQEGSSDSDDLKPHHESKQLKPSTSGSEAKNEKRSITLNIPHQSKAGTYTSSDDEDDDDPRFRRLKQLEKSKRTLSNTLQPSSSKVLPKIEPRIVIVDENDEEEEDEIRKRHALARARQLEEPIGPQTVLGNSLASDAHTDGSQLDNESDLPRRLRPGQDAEDVLNDLTFEGYKPKTSKARKAEEAEKKMKDMLEQAKQQAVLTAQLHKKIEEDNRLEMEKEALRKEGIGAVDMEAVKTDDEDEELAYEEWKLREIKRVLRDRSERVLEVKAR